MLTLDTILKAAKHMASYGDDGRGSCFGVSDPSRLRPPTTPPRRTTPQETDGPSVTLKVRRDDVKGEYTFENVTAPKNENLVRRWNEDRGVYEYVEK